MDYLICKQEIEKFSSRNPRVTIGIIRNLFELDKFSIVVCKDENNKIKYNQEGKIEVERIIEPYASSTILKSCIHLCIKYFYKTINDSLEKDISISEKMENLLIMHRYFSMQSLKYYLDDSVFLGPDINFEIINCDIENKVRDSSEFNFQNVKEDIVISFQYRYQLFKELSRYTEIRLLEYNTLPYKRSIFKINEEFGKYFLMEFIIALENFPEGYITQEISNVKLQDEIFELFGLSSKEAIKIRSNIKERKIDNVFLHLRKLLSTAENTLNKKN